MKTLEYFIPEELMYALGWTVIHSIWQGLLIAVLLACALLVLQRRPAQVRYLAAGGALLAILLSALLTFFYLYQYPSSPAESAMVILEAEMADLNFNVSAIDEGFYAFSDYFNAHLPLIVLIWFMGLSIFSLRLLGGLVYVQHLKLHNTFAVGQYWQDRLRTLANRLSLTRQFQLLESAVVRVPMVVGYFKPVILLPIGVVNGLTTSEVEAILAHELAHIARNDYLLNIVQSVIEVLFYFNPAVWWISARIRTERENCCDDMAVALCGDSLNYAKALVKIQEMHRGSPILAMSFSGRRHKLLNRVRRILNQPQSRSNLLEKSVATCLLILTLTIFSLRANINVEGPEAFWTDELLSVVVTEASELDSITLDLDIPTELGDCRIRINEDGTFHELELKDGKISALRIEGQGISERSFGEHRELIRRLLESLAVPPSKVPIPELPGFDDFEMPDPMPFPEPLPAPGLSTAPGIEPVTGKRKVMKARISRSADHKQPMVLLIGKRETGEPIEIHIEDMPRFTDYSGTLLEMNDSSWLPVAQRMRIGLPEKMRFSSQPGPPQMYSNVMSRPQPTESFSGGTHFLPVSPSEKQKYHLLATDTLPDDQREAILNDMKRSIEENLAVAMKQLKEMELQHEQILRELEHNMREYQARLKEEQLSGSEIESLQKELRKELKLTENKIRSKERELMRDMRKREAQLQRQARALHRDEVVRSRGDHLSYEFHFADPDVTYDLGNSMNLIKKELLRDKLVEPGTGYVLQLNQEELLLNGKRLPKATWEKYKKLYLQGIEQEEIGEFEITIRQKQSENTEEY